MSGGISRVAGRPGGVGSINRHSTTTVIEDDLVESAAQLRSRPGAHVLMHGFGPVAGLLLEHDLLDDLQVWVHPVLAGVGEPTDLLFRQGKAWALTLVGNRALASGVVLLSYRIRSDT